MTRSGDQSIPELLEFVASQVLVVPERTPWRYGWQFADYRHSSRAALDGSCGPVTFTEHGIAKLEEVVNQLLREQRIKARWGAGELWGIIAALAVTGSERTEDRSAFLDKRVELLRESGPALTVQLVANVLWARPPLMLGDTIMGDANAEFFKFVNARARGRANISEQLATSWLTSQVQPRIGNKAPTPVAVACWTVGQGDLAREETERQLNNIVGLTMLLEKNLADHNVFRRGDTNRPGVRGLKLDRGAIERGLEGAATLELASFPLTVGSYGKEGRVNWYSAEPLPLGELLNQVHLRDAVRSCLKENPISGRLRVAARWFAEACYTLADDDATLALGVAMDSLLSGQKALSGSVMADRFAMLSDDPSRRRQLVAEYLYAYSARSSVAHGGRSGKLDTPNFIKEYFKSVSWAAWRCLALRDKFDVYSEKEIEGVYDDLRWGTRSWK